MRYCSQTIILDQPMVGVWMGLCPVLTPGQQRCTMRTTCLLFALLVLMILQCWLILDCIDVCLRQAMCHLDVNLGKMICEQNHRPLNLFSAAYEAILGWLVCTVMLWRQVYADVLSTGPLRAISARFASQMSSSLHQWTSVCKLLWVNEKLLICQSSIH